MIDSGESDAKILAVPVADPRFKNYTSLKDINPHTLEEIKHFWTTYKQLQNKVVTIDTVRDADDAKKVVLEACELYKKENQK
jgi:inorganic pyrophosphatase